MVQSIITIERYVYLKLQSSQKRLVIGVDEAEAPPLLGGIFRVEAPPLFGAFSKMLISKTGAEVSAAS